jgi:methylphosphotriester-DNA--protein-cysteine methyltransferase
MPKTYRLLGPDGRPYDSPTKGRFGGNKRARIYGRLDCPAALAAIKRGRTCRQHRVFFADEASALAAGFRPCARCMREAYNRWRALNAAWAEQA